MGPASNRVTYFLVFLFSLGIVSGGLVSVYYEAKFKALPKRAFSTEEIAKTNKLSRMLQRRESRNTGLEAEAILLNRQIQKISQNQERTEPTVHPGKPPTQKLLSLTGIESVAGEGIEIILEDAKQPVYFGSNRLKDNPNLGIVHNQDLLLLVNQLWASGARAIAINNQRITAQTAINCAGPVVTLNKTRITSPFRVSVLGNTSTIIKVLESRKSYLKYLSTYGIPSQVKVRPLFLPASPLAKPMGEPTS